jgi:hypothetical protein
VHQNFLVPLDLIRREQIFPFDFEEDISEMERRTVLDLNGFYRIPMDIGKLVKIPQKFSEIL